MTVFPFGSEHHSSQEMLTKEVPGRLDENQRLRRELQEGQRKVLITKRGQATQSTTSLPFDWQKSSLLFEMITKGLIWHHFGVAPPSNYVVRIFAFIKTDLQFFRTKILTLNQENLRSLSLAEGGFNYTFTRNTNDPGFTAWILDFYKTLNICGTTDQGELVRLYVCALTGPPEISRIADALQGEDAA